MLYQSILNAKLTGRKNLGRKRCTSNRDERKLENTVKQSWFKHLWELHKEWTEAGVSASRVTTLRCLQEKGYQATSEPETTSETSSLGCGEKELDCCSVVQSKVSRLETSHVTRRPSLKRLSGIQVQLLSLCMGKHQILQNCSLSLRLNIIFEITNEIGQQLCHKCCFFCSNSVIKSLFCRLDQLVHMLSPERASQSADCFYSNRDF